MIFSRRRAARQGRRGSTHEASDAQGKSKGSEMAGRNEGFQLAGGHRSKMRFNPHPQKAVIPHVDTTAPGSWSSNAWKAILVEKSLITTR